MWVIAFLVGCTTGVSGVVVDAMTSKPLEGATVKIGGTALSASTDDDGEYSISDVADGRQVIEVTKDGYLEDKALEITVARFKTVAAQDVQLFPAPPGNGAFARLETGYSPFREIDEREWQTMIGAGFRQLPPSIAPGKLGTVPQLPADGVVYFYAASGSPAPLEFTVRALKRERAHTDREGSGYFVQRAKIPDRWVFASDSSFPFKKRTDLAPGLERLELDLEPGHYVLHRHHAAGIKDWYYAFMVPLPDAKLVEGPPGGRLLAAEGEYASGSQQWRTARDMVVAWCGQSTPDPACASALPDLKVEPEPGGNVACVGRLLIDKRSARFSTWECGAGIQVDLVKNEDGWAVKTLSYVPEIVEEELGD